MCEQRLREIEAGDCGSASRLTEAFVREMDAAPVALLPNLANEQHYEVPAELFGLALGPQRKYSSAWWPEGTASIDQAETAALSATCERAGLADGQEVLELGCGWGSLTLWMAEHYPSSRITGVSNSHSQRAWILAEAKRRHLGNVEIITADMNTFDAGRRFERVVSVEMFEHMRNWRLLFAPRMQLAAAEGRFLMHVFCHRSTPYSFVDGGPPTGCAGILSPAA